MATVDIQVTGALPTCYPSSPQVYAQNIVDALTATVSLAGVNFGNTTPTADNQDKPWVRTNVDGSLDALYTFTAGGWYRREQWMIGQVIEWQSDTLPNARWTWCDGTAGTLDMRGRSTVGTSQPNNTGTGLSNRVLGASGGEETHVLIEAELASHLHDVWGINTAGTGTVNTGLVRADAALTGGIGSPNAYITSNTVDNYIADAGNDDPHNTMHPFVAIGKIKYIGPQLVLAGVP